MDPLKYPKIVCDALGVSYNEQTFTLTFISGAFGANVLLDPIAAKAFSENLATRIVEFEAKTGKRIDTAGRQAEKSIPLDRL
jgi:hypothetical protein